MKLQRLCHDICRAVCICAGVGCVRKLRRIGIKMPFNVCWLFEKITSRELSPWHAIHSCSGQKVTIPELIRPLSFALISSMMCCFNALVCEVCWGTLWLSSVPRESSRAQRGQETWMATRCHHAMKWRVQETWPQNSPLIHVVCVCVCAVAPSCWNQSSTPTSWAYTSNVSVIARRHAEVGVTVRGMHCMPGAVFNEVQVSYHRTEMFIAGTDFHEPVNCLMEGSKLFLCFIIT